MNNKEVSYVAFRTDATSLIGTGHFMRCLTLALSLKNHVSHVRFVSRNLPDHLLSLLLESDIAFVPLSSDVNHTSDGDLAHSMWLGTSQAHDADATIKALSDQQWDWLVVDHYALDIRWESDLRCTTKKIMVIDDIADRQHDCDVLLDQNLYADMQTRYLDKVPVHCQLLLGPRYALLRDEFRVKRGQIKPRSGIVKNILVFFGGVDADNYTGLTLEALAGIKHNDLRVDVVIGAQHPCREQIQAECVMHGYACHVQTARMSELMAKADLAIGAGGSASWERCCVGLPSLLVALAENQIDIAKTLDSICACVYIGLAETINFLVIKHAVMNLLNSQDRLQAISKNAFSLVDGQGVNRVCLALGK
jgi:UDP-2,4-diacetamido-2,4,6-trideoxy-beta-L-altropyranose hydrolase